MKVETKSKKKLNPRVDPQTHMLIDLVHEMIGEEDRSPLDLDGTEMAADFQEYSVDEDEAELLSSNDDLNEALALLRRLRLR